MKKRLEVGFKTPQGIGIDTFKNKWIASRMFLLFENLKKEKKKEKKNSVCLSLHHLHVAKKN